MANRPGPRFRGFARYLDAAIGRWLVLRLENALHGLRLKTYRTGLFSRLPDDPVLAAELYRRLPCRLGRFLRAPDSRQLLEAFPIRVFLLCRPSYVAASPKDLLFGAP